MIENIKFLREKKGWTQETLAKKTNLKREAISNIENGNRQIKIEELGRFADVFEVSADQLLNRISLDRVTLEGYYPEKKSKTTVRINVPIKNERKFREVLLYVLNKVGARPNIGETVLYKLLYFIDFDFYEKYEEQLMGMTYKHEKYGPVPIEFSTIVQAMIEDGEIAKITTAYFENLQKKYLPLRKHKVDCISSRERELIDNVLFRLADKDATQISNYSHEDVPWMCTDSGEIIDYESVFYRTSKYSMRDYSD